MQPDPPEGLSPAGLDVRHALEEVDTGPPEEAGERGTTVSTIPETVTEDGKSEPRKCRAVKHGGVTLHCTELEGHDKGPDGTWHMATYRKHEEHSYDGSRHVVDLTETVWWEPFDHIGEATRHLMAGRAGE